MPTIDGMMDILQDSNEKSEKKLIRDLTTQYSLTLSEARNIVNDFIEKYGENGKFDIKEAGKFKRSDKLIARMTLLVALNSRSVKNITEKTLKSDYANNYYFTGYVLEGATGIRSITKPIDEDIFVDILHTSVDKVAIQNNAMLVKANIRRDLTVAMQQGLSARETSRMIKKSLTTNANNALRIAQTEQTRLINEGRMRALQQGEKKGAVIFKVWDALLDRRTRSSHAELDGDAIPLDKKFSNGLRFPGDPLGKASEVINCRCVLKFITGEGKKISRQFIEFNEWKKENNIAA